MRYGCPWFVDDQTTQKMSKTYILKQIENMHGHWFISLGQQEYAYSGSVLHFIQISWFTLVFANICRMPKWVNFADAA